MFITNDKISTNKLTIRMKIKTFLCQQLFALFSVVNKTQTMYKCQNNMCYATNDVVIRFRRWNFLIERIIIIDVHKLQNMKNCAFLDNKRFLSSNANNNHVENGKQQKYSTGWLPFIRERYHPIIHFRSEVLPNLPRQGTIHAPSKLFHAATCFLPDLNPFRLFIFPEVALLSSVNTVQKWSWSYWNASTFQITLS